MLNLETIDFSALPSLPLEQRSQLPTTPCIYFAIDAQGVVQYIGKAKNARQRWIGSSHHCYKNLLTMGGVRLAHLVVDDAIFLSEIESALIAWFNPVLNRTVTSARPKRVGAVKIRRFTDYDIPNLEIQIKKARLDSPKSVTELAAEAGMSVANWYRIEGGKVDVLPETTLSAIESALGVIFLTDPVNSAITTDRPKGSDTDRVQASLLQADEEDA
ncbi:MAG: hypothetical protein KME45_03255 [Stenomitos rutilans HA7619-LM2]|jgi:DNA-binding Xre family transcriptional regulator|nr:hypothetical protein [Stenomitos rutilans HA7619-LM2]MBW4469402.1 hypothetical protein [Stenomitos rutilans HA7619-LM2]